MESPSPGSRTVSSSDKHEQVRPPPPLGIEQTGLPFFFLIELAAKVLFKGGSLRQSELVDRLKLLPRVLEPLLDFMRAERLIEVQPHSKGEPVHHAGKDFTYALTDLGRERAAQFMQRSQYAGPAPVSLDAYIRQVKLQSMSDCQITRQTIHTVFEDIVVKPSLLDQFGAAMNSGRAVFVYGPPGAGKTFIAERLVGLMLGGIYVPHAFLVDGEIVQVFDPLVHTPRKGHAKSKSLLERDVAADGRWMFCDRPVVVNGGELTLSMLDLQFDREARYYTAPPQLKANNGLLIIDDLGRQLAAPQAIMNRWIVPMDRRVDYLALHTGSKFQVPFDLNLIFSTNLQPASLADEAFLRRLGYKIYVGPLDEADFEAIFKQVCEAMGVPFDPAGLEYILQRHAQEGRPLLACTPRDLLGQLRDQARFRDLQPTMTTELLQWAWENYFVRT